MIKLNEIRTGDYVEVLEIPELAALESQGSVVALRLQELSGITVRYYL